MRDFQSKGQRFVALCMLGMVLFNYPILALFNVPGACSACRCSTCTSSSPGRR
jgi:hypothetical protein